MPVFKRAEDTGEYYFRGRWYESFDDAQDAYDQYMEMRVEQYEYDKWYGEVPDGDE